jgi:rhodanese-related sulfurtransferase
MVTDRTPAEIERALRASPPSVTLLDVREVFERRLAVIEPSLHIPMNEVPARLSEIPPDRPVVVYCHTGVRSAIVAGFLESHGYRSVANLRGGIEAWSLQVDPTVPRYG